MQPLVLHDSAAEILFGANLALWVAFETVVSLGTEARGRTSREWTLRLIMVTVVSSIVLAGVLAEHQLAPLPGAGWWSLVAGLILLWVGVAFRSWAIRTLGHFFKMTVIVQEDHRVVDRGPYRWLRHPSYTAALMSTTGVGLAYGDWTSIAVMLMGPLVAFLIRIRLEERVLLEELGEEYAAYSRRTARLIPGLY